MNTTRLVTVLGTISGVAVAIQPFADAIPGVQGIVSLIAFLSLALKGYYSKGIDNKVVDENVVKDILPK